MNINANQLALALLLRSQWTPRLASATHWVPGSRPIIVTDPGE